MAAPQQTHPVPAAGHGSAVATNSAEHRVWGVRLPPGIPPARAFIEAGVPARIADHLQMRLRHFRGSLYAMEYDRETSHAFWMSATAAEILLVVIPGLSRDETAEVRNRSLEVGDPDGGDRVCRVCADVTGRMFVNTA